MKSLVAEFLASTRGPIGSSDLFNDLFDAPPRQTSKSRGSKMKYSTPRRDLFWVLLIYLIAFAGAIVAAAVFLLG
jgi:hypothetical protein